MIPRAYPNTRMVCIQVSLGRVPKFVEKGALVHDELT